jgi:hypothetical protein
MNRKKNLISDAFCSKKDQFKDEEKKLKPLLDSQVNSLV